MKAFLLTLVFSFAANSFAATAVVATCGSPTDSSFVSAAIHAKSAGEVERFKAETCDLEFNRRVCAAELRGHQLPTACLTVLNAEKAKALITNDAFIEQQSHLGAVCIARAAESHDQADLGEASLSNFAPCAAAARERLKDLEYAASDDHPEQMFQKRFLPPTSGHRIESPHVESGN